MHVIIDHNGKSTTADVIQLGICPTCFNANGSFGIQQVVVNISENYWAMKLHSPDLTPVSQSENYLWSTQGSGVRHDMIYFLKFCESLPNHEETNWTYDTFARPMDSILQAFALIWLSVMKNATFPAFNAGIICENRQFLKKNYPKIIGIQTSLQMIENFASKVDTSVPLLSHSDETKPFKIYQLRRTWAPPIII